MTPFIPPFFLQSVFVTLQCTGYSSMMKAFVLLSSLFFGLCPSLFAHGDIHERIEIATRRIEQHPDSADLYLRRGTLFTEHGEFQKAKTDFEHARAWQPGLNKTLWLMAELYLSVDSPEIALSYISDFLTKEPGHVLGVKTRARIFSQLGQYGNAVKDYKEVINRADQTIPQNYFDLAEVSLLDDESNLEGAIEAISMGIERLGFIISLYEKVIQLEAESGDYETAHELITQVVERLPRHERWLVIKAEMYEKQGLRTEAELCWEKAKEAIRQLPLWLRETETVKEYTVRIDDALKN